MEFLQTSDKLEISEGSRENLLQNVSDMKITMSNSSAQGEKQEKFKRKCRYNDKGYCKYIEKCKFQHFQNICGEYLEKGKFGAGPTCQNRHPKICKYWKSDRQGCKRTTKCRYLHQNHPSTHNNKVAEKETNMELIDKNVNESKQKDNPEDNDTIQKVAELEALIAIKINKIIELKQAENNLQKENENNKQSKELLPICSRSWRN